jgi:2-polyprenyl-3-methyl-5-hydroxy-6-metoxy-1,4-benzoquinol methylase
MIQLKVLDHHESQVRHTVSDPDESKTRILVAIASYGTSNDDLLVRVVEEYRSMPFAVDIVVLSNIHKEVGPDIEVAVGLPSKDPWSLPFGHKKIFADRLNDYDLFLYSEDDILITERNIRAFLQASKVLPDDEIAGFFRFEIDPNGQTYFPEVHARHHWDIGSVRVRGEYTFGFFTNEHSACYLLTRKQLQRAIASGGFLVGPHKEMHDLLCTAATDPYTQCGFKKLICLSHLQDFLVRHLSDKYLARMGTAEPEVRRQIQVLLGLGGNGHARTPLFPTHSKLMGGRFSKSYYEPVLMEVISKIPDGTRTVLSLGCGWGATEAFLAEKGLCVTAVPLDPVIPGGAIAKGVKIVEGDFKTAKARLSDQRFDCLVLSNVLHLVENPVEILSSFAGLVSDRGSVVTVLPNLLKLSLIWKKYLGREGLSELGDYEKSGVHFTSHGVARRWLQSAGLELESFTNIFPRRAETSSRLALGLMDSLLASEFVASAVRKS